MTLDKYPKFAVGEMVEVKGHRFQVMQKDDGLKAIVLLDWERADKVRRAVKDAKRKSKG